MNRVTDTTSNLVKQTCYHGNYMHRPKVCKYLRLLYAMILKSRHLAVVFKISVSYASKNALKSRYRYGTSYQ